MPHSQQLNNGGWWKPELGSTLSLSHSEWQESPGLVSFGDKVLHLPALLCLHLPTTDDCKSAELFSLLLVYWTSFTLQKGEILLL